MQWYTTSMVNDSQNFRNLPKDSESFGNLPNITETFRSFPNARERTENHTLTVRETARMFESAGVARTERSIINWCNPNKQGIARLGCYFDPNEGPGGKYFITPQSVDLAIKEEQAKFGKVEGVAHPPDSFGTIPKSSEAKRPAGAGQSEEEVRQLKARVRRLTLEGEVSKHYVEKLEVERERFFTQMLEQSRQIGVLETKLLQLEAPKQQPAGATIPRQESKAREVEFDESRDWQSGEPVRIPVAGEPEPTQTKQL